MEELFFVSYYYMCMVGPSLHKGVSNDIIKMRLCKDYKDRYSDTKNFIKDLTEEVENAFLSNSTAEKVNINIINYKEIE